jgi:hypothetical protein
MFFIVLESKSQILEKDCLHYPYNTQVGISLNTNLLSKMRIEPNYQISSPPSEYFRSSPSFGTGLGVYLYQRVYKWFGIQIGVEYSHITMCYGGTANFTGLSNKTSLKYYTEMFTFPILFNASYYFNEKHGLDISLAPFMLRVTSAPIRGLYSTDKEIRNNNGDYCWFGLRDYVPYGISFYGKVGYNYLFKNKNTLGVAIVGGYNSEPYAQGRYVVDMNDGTRVEEGRVSLRNTFIGLQFSYGFSMKKTLCTPDKLEIETE